MIYRPINLGARGAQGLRCVGVHVYIDPLRRRPKRGARMRNDRVLGHERDEKGWMRFVCEEFRGGNNKKGKVARRNY